MIVLRKLVLVTAIAAGSGLLSPQGVSAFELTGPWATNNAAGYSPAKDARTRSISPISPACVPKT